MTRFNLKKMEVISVIRSRDFSRSFTSPITVPKTRSRNVLYQRLEPNNNLLFSAERFPSLRSSKPLVRRVQPKIGANQIINGEPTQGIPWSAQGFESTADSDPYGVGFNSFWKHYYTKGIDYWKAERKREKGKNLFSLTMDYNATGADFKNGRLGDAYIAFIQDTQSWGLSGEPTQYRTIQINRKVRTVLEAEVRSSAIPGKNIQYQNDKPFGRMTFSTQPGNFQRAQPNNGDASVTLDFDWWQGQKTKNFADSNWWFTSNNSAFGAPANEYYPRYDSNNTGVFTMPIQGVTGNPERLTRDKWVKVYVDLSWAYEWVLHFHKDKISNASSLTAFNPPTLFRLFNALEGNNLAAKMSFRNVKIRDWDLKDSNTRSKYIQAFDANSNRKGRSYPFNSHWGDHIVNLFD
jgi:hypothetical protein